MNILEMPIEWQQRSANTFSMPMPVRKTPYSQWLRERNLPPDAAALVATALAHVSTAAGALIGTSTSKKR
jgi:hypothetical protein